MLGLTLALEVPWLSEREGWDEVEKAVARDEEAKEDVDERGAKGGSWTLVELVRVLARVRVERQRGRA